MSAGAMPFKCPHEKVLMIALTESGPSPDWTQSGLHFVPKNFKNSFCQFLQRDEGQTMSDLHLLLLMNAQITLMEMRVLPNPI
jgi:hypothetical protein